MRIWTWTWAAAMLAAAGYAQAASRDIHYGPPLPWVVPTPAPTSTEPHPGAPVRTIFADWQASLGSDGDSTYTAYRVKILTPEGLAAGNVTVTWNPSADDVTVHVLKIIRDGHVIDVLAASKFQVIERENNLDYAVLDGQLTATLQTPGLAVGDEIEFAATIRRLDPTLGERSQGFVQLPLVGAPGAYRFRLIWPEAKALRWRATPDLPQPRPAGRGGQEELIYELRDPASVVTTDGAPSRMNLRRLIEYSGFSSWAEVSGLLSPLFDRAATLAPDSPVRLEASKIAASTNDPAARVEAALRLVQERIRYVYVGLDGANYRPASADETWSRRFGDCKAKTALLIAILRELRVAGEPALVSTQGGDGTDQLLPTTVVFDHVVVKTTIGGQTYWLDGTRSGDRHLAALPSPAFRWALPLRAGSATLEAVNAAPPAAPQATDVLDVDASGGFETPAKVAMEQIVRGDGVFQLRTQLASLAPEDAERAVKAYWRQQMNWAEPASAGWRYDETQNALVLTMNGEGKLKWDGDDKQGRSLDIMGAGFTPPNELRRPREQDQTAPWVTDFPSYRCWVTTIRLPPETIRWRWDYAAEPVNLRLGGIAYWRAASLRGAVMHTLMSKRTFVREISPAEAKAVNDGLPTFDNNISRVFQSSSRTLSSRARASAPTPAKGEAAPIDWAGPAPPCAAPAGP